MELQKLLPGERQQQFGKEVGEMQAVYLRDMRRMLEDSAERDIHDIANT